MKTAALRNVSWEDSRDSAAKIWNQASGSGKDMAYRIGLHVRRHPWKALAVAMGAGMLVGAMVSMTARK
jgi:ElaB/YqjD/DUF883 family membrane-anchored ribosome-binding protein